MKKICSKCSRIICSVVATVFIGVLASGCGQAQDVVTAAQKQHHEFVGEKPQKADVVGTYILIDQTITEDGITALQGRECRLDILADGTFSIINYPDWRTLTSGPNRQFSAFISTSGRWTLGMLGTSYGYGPTPKEIWGFEFSEEKNKIDSTAFTGPNPPYGLLTPLGDPDSNETMRFIKKEDSTKSPTVTE